LCTDFVSRAFRDKNHKEAGKKGGRKGQRLYEVLLGARPMSETIAAYAPSKSMGPPPIKISMGT